MMSVGVCGFASVLAIVADAAGFEILARATTSTSADASWKLAARGFERGTGTGSADFAGTAAAIRLAADGFAGPAAAPSSSSSATGLPRNREASRLGLLE